MENGLCQLASTKEDVRRPIKCEGFVIWPLSAVRRPGQRVERIKELALTLFGRLIEGDA